MKHISFIIVILAIAGMMLPSIGYSMAIPIAIGIDVDGTDSYVALYNNKTVIINNLDTENITYININSIPNNIITKVISILYSSKNRDIVLIGFYNESKTIGVTFIRVYNVEDGLIYSKDLRYKLEGDTIKGKIATEVAYISDKRMIVYLYSNSTSTYIELEGVVNGDTRIIESPVAFNFYVNGGKVYVATVEKGVFQDREVGIVKVKELTSGSEVASYPSLIPVLQFAYPMVQVFYENNTWVGYVIVYNPSMKKYEYFRVEPGSLKLEDWDPVVVSPDLEYAVKLGKDGSYIVLPSGVSYSLGYDVRPSPASIYTGLDPRNAVLDISGNRVLLRIVSGNETRIVYKVIGEGEATVYTMQGRYTKLQGLYAYMVGHKIVIQDPVANKIIEIDLSNIKLEEQVSTSTGYNVTQTGVADAEQPMPEGPGGNMGLVALFLGLLLIVVVVYLRVRRR